MSNTEMTQVKQESRQLDHMNSRLSDSLFSKELAPHYMKLAGQLAASEIVPKCYRNKPSDLFLCWAKGYQLGISPEQAMDCISVINGKAVMWGDEMLALCMSHPDFEDIEEHPIRTGNDAVIGYICTILRKGRKPKSSEFTLDMAKKAGLLAKGGVWNQYPERMLKLRARGFALRDAFPDALKGIKSREEVEDYIDVDYTVTEQKSSRTERLKQEILIKQGDKDDALHGSMESDDHQIPLESDSKKSLQQEENETICQASGLHSEIKRLFIEKRISEERMGKILAYYEVKSVEELIQSAAEHLIQQLNKI